MRLSWLVEVVPAGTETIPTMLNCALSLALDLGTGVSILDGNLKLQMLKPSPAAFLEPGGVPAWQDQ